MAFADSYSISVAVGVGSDEIDSGAAAGASASIDDWFAFTPDPGQNAPVAARIELRVLPSVQGSEIRWRGTFQGSELPYTNFTFFDTVPYTGDPFEVTVTGIADASINPYEGGTGGVEMYLRPTIMLDAEGNAVTGMLTLVPEPAYWPLILLLCFAVTARRARSRCLE